jgi:hypothetical protein
VESSCPVGICHVLDHVHMTDTSPTSYQSSSPMVSQPFPAERAQSVRGPPSIASRSTTTRRHRSNRSHHGGTSYQPQNEFPNFAHTGDVEIVVKSGGQEKRYMLHRLILARSSGFFEAGTSEEWSRAQPHTPDQGRSTAQAPRGSLGSIGEEDESSFGGRAGASTFTGQKPFWRYVLESGIQDDEVPMLVQKVGWLFSAHKEVANNHFQPPEATLFGGDLPHRPRDPPAVRNKPPAPSNGFFRTFSAMQSAIHIPHILPQSNSEDNDIIRDYDNLFKIFYNYPPTLDGVNITEAYIQCKSLLNLADMYDALEVVGPRIDHHLLQFQGRLWKQIAKYPPSYLKLGYLARSKVIFAEALVHVVGQWPTGSQQLRNIPQVVLELIEDKVDELNELKEKIEGKLFRLTLTTTRGDRVSPWNGNLEWQAVSLFRHWLAENLSPPPPKPAPQTSHHHPSSHQPSPPSPTPESSGRVYKTLGQGGSAYLGHDELKRFMRANNEGYSRDNFKRFERRMEEVKGLAKEVVKPLMRSFLELDGRDAGMGYLTCTRVGEGDFPWD